MRSYKHILATSALVITMSVSTANAMNPAAATKVDAPDPSQNPNSRNQYVVGQSNQPGGPGSQLAEHGGDSNSGVKRGSRGQGGPDMGEPEKLKGKGQDNQAYGDSTSDSVKAELKIYFEKKKALRDALSPQAKAVLDKRRVKNMKKMDDMGGDDMMGGPVGQSGPGAGNHPKN